MQYFSIVGMFGMGGHELLIVMVVILVLFGGKQIPSLMRNLGKGATEFKRGLKEPDPEPEPEPEPEPKPEPKESATEPEAGSGDDEKSE
jgi:sec-independent protein translocase protein TatA